MCIGISTGTVNKICETKDLGNELENLFALTVQEEPLHAAVISGSRQACECVPVCVLECVCQCVCV